MLVLEVHGGGVAPFLSPPAAPPKKAPSPSPKTTCDTGKPKLRARQRSWEIFWITSILVFHLATQAHPLQFTTRKTRTRRRRLLHLRESSFSDPHPCACFLPNGPRLNPIPSPNRLPVAVITRRRLPIQPPPLARWLNSRDTPSSSFCSFIVRHAGHLQP